VKFRTGIQKPRAADTFDFKRVEVKLETWARNYRRRFDLDESVSVEKPSDRSRDLVTFPQRRKAIGSPLNRFA
jgi:hypothetical protein